MTPAAYPRVALNDGLRHRRGSALFAAAAVRRSTQKRARRAGPALPSYLALHHAGFSVPPMSPPERWALTPPFHPYLTERAAWGRAEARPYIYVGVPQVFLRDATVLLPAGGIFSVALSVNRSTGLSLCSLSASRFRVRCKHKPAAQTEVCATVPLELPGALPFTLNPR